MVQSWILLNQGNLVPLNISQVDFIKCCVVLYHVTVSFQPKRCVNVSMMELMMTEKRKRVPGPRPKGGQTIVRYAVLEETLENYTHETGQRLSAWFAGVVQPLFMDFEARIAALEWGILPWYKKLWYRWKFKCEKQKELRRASKAQPEAEKVPETADPGPETAPETPSEAPPQRETRVCARCTQKFIVHDQSRICPVCVLKDNE